LLCTHICATLGCQCHGPSLDRLHERITGVHVYPKANDQPYPPQGLNCPRSIPSSLPHGRQNVMVIFSYQMFILIAYCKPTAYYILPAIGAYT